MGKSTVLYVDWHVSPCESPRLWRHCSRCEAKRPFQSSDKFRTNLQKKRVDVWLIYRCLDCGLTWNRPILERRPMKDMDQEELRAFAENCGERALRRAFDLAGVRRLAERVDVPPEVRVTKCRRAGVAGDAAALEIGLRARFDSTLRIDRFLAKEFGLSRAAISRLHDERALRIAPERRAALRQTIRDRQVISVDLGPLRDRPELVAAILRGALSFRG